MKAKTIVSIAAAFALVMALVPAVALADEGTTPGSFQCANKAPTVESIAIDPSSMTPQEEWTVINVTVKDRNKLSDVDEVEVTLFYDSAGSDPSAPGSADVHNCSILTWDRFGGGSEWTIAPAATAWSIDSANCSKGSDSLSQDVWTFQFKVGKVATESPGSDDWDIYAIATDNASTNGSLYERDKEMLFYGEITVNTGSVNWGIVDPGLAFEGTNSSYTGIDVDYIANGDYDEKISASSSWTGGPGATLNTSGTPLGQEFSLKANVSATYSGAPLVVAYSSFTTIDNTGTITEESGDSVTTNTIWLSLGEPFEAATYSGTIYYKIDNG